MSAPVQISPALQSEQRLRRALVRGVPIAVVIVFLWDLLMPAGVAGCFFYVLPVGAALLWRDPRAPISWAAACAGLTLVVLAHQWVRHEPSFILINRASTIAVLLAMGVALTWWRKLGHAVDVRLIRRPSPEPARAVTDQPALIMCAACSSVHEPGQDYRPVAQYMAEKGSFVSHGICPACAFRLYGVRL